MLESRFLKQFPPIDDMRFSYIRLRSKKLTREDALKELILAEEKLCPPYEERLFRRMGLADAMAERQELTEEVAVLAEEALGEYLRLHPRAGARVQRMRQQLLAPEGFGPAADYPPWVEYSPGWQAGDLFCLPLSGYFPRLFHTEGKYALLYAVGERKDAEGYTEELCYLSLCEEETLPGSLEELNTLGFLPAFTLFRDYQYLFALRFRREKEYTALKLKKLGSYPGPLRLYRERPNSDRGAMELVPSYAGSGKIILERAICASYQHFGLIANAGQAAEARLSWNYGGDSRESAGEPPLDISMASSPTQKLGSRIYFSHYYKMRNVIPRRSRMTLED